VKSKREVEGLQVIFTIPTFWPETLRRPAKPLENIRKKVEIVDVSERVASYPFAHVDHVHI
jgi:hypothetical protein